jgi:TIR domain/AAA domain
MTPSPSVRSRVFICYSHTDARFLQRLQIQLAPEVRNKRVDLWDDTKITPGKNWRIEIEHALQTAKIAVLLVSADFLASELIALNELPSLLSAAEAEGVTILPVLLKPCLYKHTPLAKFQFVNKPLIPLEKMRNVEREETWMRVAEAITAALSTPSAPIVPVVHFSARTEKAFADNDIFFFNERLLDPQEFFGRKQERITLIRRARRGSSTSIVGPRRIGKTWLIEYLIQVAPDELGPGYRIGYLNATMPHCDTVAGFTEAALDSLGVHVQSGQAALNLKALAAATKKLQENHLAPILCIDEFEGLSNKAEFNLLFFRELRAIGSSSLGLVIASKRTLMSIVGNDGYTSGFFNIFEACNLKPFNEKDAREFVQIKGEQAKFSEQECTLLLKYGQLGEQQWHPLRLQLAGQLLLDDKNEGNCYPNEQDYQRSFTAKLEEKYRAVVEE